jgi:hypothetical protein
VLGAERNNELLVGLLLARLVEDAHVCLAAIQGLGGLAQTAGKSVVDQGELENALEGLEDRHLALAGGIGANFDFDLTDLSDLGLFSVRLWACMLVIEYVMAG